MQAEIKERWQRLCEQAAAEQDPEQLMILIQEITELLGAKEKRLRRLTAKAKSVA